MQILASNKVVCALLAVVLVGMGAQTWYVMKVQRQLEAWRGEPAAAVDSAPQDDRNDSAGVPAALPAPDVLPDAFAELEGAHERMRQLFDSFHARFERDLEDVGFGDGWPLGSGDPFLLARGGTVGPRVDLQDRGDRYELAIDVPGTDASEVSVSVEDGLLTVSGTRSSASESSDPGSYVRRERQFGRFERRLALPADADPATLSTTRENGVLRVTLTKRMADANAAPQGA